MLPKVPAGSERHVVWIGPTQATTGSYWVGLTGSSLVQV